MRAIRYAQIIIIAALIAPAVVLLVAAGLVSKIGQRDNYDACEGVQRETHTSGFWR